MNEIEEARRSLELDLKELKERIPGPLRSLKSVIGAVVGSAVVAFVIKRIRSKRSHKNPQAEVVVRIVRDDE